MVPLLTPDLNPLTEFRRRGIAASLAWPADHDCDALVMVDDADNVARLERWIKQPRGIEARPTPAFPLMRTKSQFDSSGQH